MASDLFYPGGLVSAGEEVQEVDVQSGKAALSHAHRKLLARAAEVVPREGEASQEEALGEAEEIEQTAEIGAFLLWFTWCFLA